MAKQIIKKVKAVSCERSLIITGKLDTCHGPPLCNLSESPMQNIPLFIQASPLWMCTEPRFIMLITKYNRVVFSFPELVKERLSGPVSGSLNLLLETVRFGIPRKRIRFHGEENIASDGSAETK
jgi:hypothetical protein